MAEGPPAPAGVSNFADLLAADAADNSLAAMRRTEALKALRAEMAALAAALAKPIGAAKLVGAVQDLWDLQSAKATCRRCGHGLP